MIATSMTCVKECYVPQLSYIYIHKVEVVYKLMASKRGSCMGLFYHGHRQASISSYLLQVITMTPFEKTKYI